MRTAPRLAIASAVVGAALLSTGRQATTQRSAGTLSVSVGYATPVSELRRWDAAVDRMVRTGELVVTSRRADGALTERSHEHLAQHVAGIPVHGAGVSRQLDRGVTVSLLGTLHRDVEVETAPVLSPAEAARHIALATGEAPAAPPRLVILPWPDGSYSLAYSVGAEDGSLHFIDAVRGGLVATLDALAPSVPARADAGPGAGRATDFGAGARLGPRRFTDDSGRAYTCESARLPVRVRGVRRSLPALCDDGRFVLASPQGRAVVDALFAIFPGAAGVFRTGMGAPAGGTPAGGRPTGHGGWNPAALAGSWSGGTPDAYPFRVEFALAGDHQSWHYSNFAFQDGRLAETTGDCCQDGRDRNSAILARAFHLAVEGGTNPGTGLWVAGAGPAHRELVAQIFHRALTELLPPAVSFPLAAEAIRQSAADLAPDTVVERAVEQALEAVGLPPLYTAGRGDATAERGDAGAHPDGGAGERRSGHSPAHAALPSKPSATAGRPADFDVQATEVGHYNYESPHSNPVALLPDGSLLYAANTPADTVDVIDTATRTVVARVDVGIDPVGVAVRPDGREVWVANHVSDSVSVIDADPASPTRHHVLATVQVFDAATRSTRFDEPVGIAFAGNAKAYVALSSSNRVAVVDVASRSVTTFLQITAQDPRALAVSGGRLYVAPFESNNQTQLSGCWPENIDGELCTFDARVHVTEAPDGNAQSLSLGYVADIVRHPDIPDRDLYVFDTATDELVEVVDTLGTLLYGVAADSTGRVFIAQTEARNDANGKAGTEGHGMAELENRAFLNRITRVACGAGCGAPAFFELEPVPPADPARDEALATPFGIAVSGDDSTLVVTAAASSRVFTVDADTGAVLGRADVGAMPRGVALESTAAGAPARAWVLNALGNSVSVVDLSDPAAPEVEAAIVLEDPTDPDLKRGRIAFNSAEASSTGTFACASCHPDGHTDQLLWVLDTPLCDVGCDQIQPRLVQDIRGLRGSAPYHWDGVPGDPFGGVNTANIRTPIEPNCDGDVPESCTGHLVDGSLATTMCELSDCETNDEGKPGRLSGAERAAMAKYLLSVPYPPSPERPYTNELTARARAGINEFHNTKQCANCHRLPFWTMTNMGGSGMDVPSWRGANDRWKNAPQNRFFFADLVGGDTRGFPERFGFVNDQEMFQMIVEGSVGFSGALGRQLTLNADTVSRPDVADLLDALEQSASEGGVVLHATGILLGGGLPPPFTAPARPLDLVYRGGAYRAADGRFHSRRGLYNLAAAGDLLLTVTARLGHLTGYQHPQPTLRPLELPVLPMFPGGRPAEFPELHANAPMRLRGEHIRPGAWLVVDGRRVEGSVRCETGTLPDCEDDIAVVRLARLPDDAGLHLLQVQNPHGLFSNDFVFHVVDAPPRAGSGNLIGSGGTFDGRGAWRVGLTNASVTWNGEADFTIDEPSPQRWRVQLWHPVAIRKDVEYSLCYSAKADDIRYIETNVDTGAGDYRSLVGTGFDPEVGAATRSTGASLTRRYHRFRHRFIAPEDDSSARVTFDLAQSAVDVQIDDVGLYEGRGCGTP